MPVVPIQDLPTQNPQQTPDVRQQSPIRLMQMATIGSSHDVQNAHELGQAGSNLSAMALNQQVHENETNVKQYDANLLSGGAAILNGDPNDPNNGGYLSKVGADASSTDNKQAALDAVDNLAKTTASATLTNPAQQEMASDLTTRRVAAFKEEIEKHATKQGYVANGAAETVRYSAARNLSASSYDPQVDKATPDPNYDPANGRSTYQEGLLTAQASANALIDHDHGTAVPPDQRAEYLKTYMSNVYGDTLDHLLAGGGKTGTSQLDTAQLAIAKNYFNSVKDTFNPAQSDHFNSLMAAGENKTNATDNALDIMSTKPVFGDQLKEADARYKAGTLNADEYHSAIAIMTSRESANKSADSEAQKTFLGNVWNGVRKNTYSSVNDLSAAQLAYAAKNNLGPHVDAMFSHTSTTDAPKMFMDLMTMSQDDPAKFMALGSGGIASFQGQLSTPNFNALVNTYTAINRNDVSQQTSDKLMHQTVQNATRQLDAAGVNTHPKEGSDDEANLAKFQTDLRQQLVAAQQQKKAPLTADEANQIALSEVKTQALAGTGLWGYAPYFDTKVPPYKMTPEQRASNWAISDADTARITGKLQAAKRPVTPENIQRYYKNERH